MTLADPDLEAAAPLFARRLGAHGDRVAVVTADGSMTYAELDDRVGELSARLGRNRRLVMVHAANAVEPLVAYLAALRGAHPVLLAPPEASWATRALTDVYEPDVVVRGEGSEWEVDERRATSAHELHPDLALVLSTSGSTGSSKLVRLSHQNLQSNAEAIATFLRLSPADRALTTLPMSYCYGLSVINSHLASGAGVVLTDSSVVDPCLWDVFRASGATGFAGVPHTFDLLDRVGFETMHLPSLRYVTQAGGRLHPDSVRRYAALGERDGWELFVMYGQTEATARMAYLPPALASSHPQAIGVPIGGGSFAIDSPDERGVGELVYRGPNIMLGYAEGPGDLASGSTIDSLHTGDLARVGDSGLYELHGRCSRLIKLYGVRIGLDEVERMLAERGVRSACTGDDDHLLVVVEPGHDAPSIARFLSGRLGVPCTRVRVVEVAALPMLTNGKPDYVRARDAAAANPPTGPPVADAVRAEFAEVLGCRPSATDSFVSLGGDSLSYVEMSIRLEEVLGTLPRDWHTTAVGDLRPARGPSRAVRAMETSVVLRAVAIVLVVGTHTGLWSLPGGAHVLLGIAGYNLARFQLRSATLLRSIARIAAPSMAWIGVVAATSDDFGWRHVVLLNGYLGGPGVERAYWFVEALVQLLVPVALLMAIPFARRLERARPFGLPIAVAVVGLIVRFDLIDVVSTPRVSRPHEVLWIFAIGWAAARATDTKRRALVSLLVLVAVPGWFGAPGREAIVAAGLLLVVWLPTVPVPRPVNRVVGAIAGASLYIYLTHWQVYPPVVRQLGPELAAAISLLAGVGVWLAARWLIGAVEGRLLLYRRRRTVTTLP